MKLSRKGWLAVGLTAAFMSTAALAAGLWSTLPIVGNASFCASTVTGAGGLGGATGQGQASTGSICGQTVPSGPPLLLGGELIPADTGLQQPATVTIPSSLLGNFSGTPRNYLDNGDFAVQQYGTGIITCAQNAGQTVTTHVDRWGCGANVAVGAGRIQITTSVPAAPTGFSAMLRVYRTSGALLQPVCAYQEIPTVRATELAGKTVTLSAFETALAGLVADNSGLTTMSIFVGTGTDEGLGTMTASPAITPAWTGIAFVVNQQVITVSTTAGRYSVTGTIPATATEVGVAICFTPTATGAGTTDGFAFTGAQLEVAPSPTAFEFVPFENELRTAQRYFWRITESATVISRRDSGCAVSTTSLAVCQINFPQVMRVAPTMTYTAGFTLTVAAQTSAVVCTATRTSTTLTGAAANTQGVPIDCTSAAGFGAAGTAAQLYDLGTGSSTGIINAFADF
jgi:hypothetical protein